MPIIKCPDCSNEMSDLAPACPNCGKPNANAPVPERKPSILLWVGIVFAPILFAWFTLRKGYTNKVKGIAFSWMVITLIFVASQGDSNGSSGSPKTASADTIINVEMQTLLGAYQSNEVGADNEFKGNLIQVRGIVGDVKKDFVNNLYVMLGTGAQFEIPQVQAFFDDSMNDQLAQLRKGQTITVVCRVEGLMMNVLAQDCIIK
ncbi:MAG: hypothetical protein HWE26_21985 [Alteromonadaceae bacterium]|nr:hypothetical protein [Alteromonadaceae bacterium]